jgi:hypothetical protein
MLDNKARRDEKFLKGSMNSKDSALISSMYVDAI